MSKKRPKKTDATSAAQTVDPEIITIEAPRKVRKEPTQKEVDEGVAAMAAEIEETRDRAVFLHGRVKAGFALIGLAASIARSGGTADTVMLAMDALHDDWIRQTVEAVFAFEQLTGEEFPELCNTCGGPACDDHEPEHTCGQHDE